MRRTGRTLTLANTITATAPVNSIEGGGFRLTTIFNDDREGYAWRVTSMKRMGLPGSRIDEGFALYSTKPDSFESALGAFRPWALGKARFSNQLIATVHADLNTQLQYESLKANHMAVQCLSLFYVEGDLPAYVIELEEYEITDNEEILYRIKEISQSLNDTEDQ